MDQSRTAPFGSWRSPITSALIVEGGIRLGQLEVSGADVYWLEGRPREGGRHVLVRRAHDQTIELTPDGINVRTRVHEYGGGAYWVHGSTVYFASWADQRLYRQDITGGDPTPITPEPDLPAGARYADGRVTPDGGWIICVRELHAEGHEAVNELVIIPGDGSAPPRALASGHDFYAFPRLSPDGRQLAWTSWDHPNMPWDGCELWVADLDTTSGTLSGPRKVAGGPDESIFQPGWSPDGTLHFVSDRTGWWNLYREREGIVGPLAPMEAEFGEPQWGFGDSRYTFLADGSIACAFDKDGRTRLGLIERGLPGLRELDTPYTSIDNLRSDGQRLYFLGASPTEFPAVVALDPATGSAEVLRRARELGVDVAYFSAPQPIEFPTEGGLTAHALYYAPANRDYSGPAGVLPPLLVHSHGGPTGAASSALDLNVQYWTSRGFAVVDVNYGGSTGYGRPYRQRLNGQWGIVDVADCANAARYLAQRGDVDGRRLIIRGGSAGGYTTLSCLVFTNVFAAGASHYGIADLETFVVDTHKFESRYIDSLVGPYPEMREVYRARSAINFIDHMSCPVILFQGLEDKIVPPSQAEQMVAVLRARGLPFAYVAFEGEQHGFRRAENIQRALDGELYFYARVFGFDTAEPIEPVEIENL